MIIVEAGSGNTFYYYSRYSQINKYEILDHNSRIVDSGNTLIVGYGGKINHTGITYSFDSNNVFTYKSYYIPSGSTTEYLAAHLLLQSYSTEVEMLDPPFVQLDKPKNTFKTYKNQTIRIIYDFGSASFVGSDIVDGGSASSVGTDIIDGNL